MAGTVFSAALDCLTRWRAGPPLGAIPFPDEHRRLLTDLLNRLFRHLGTIDWCIDQCLTTQRLKPKFRDIIRLGLCSAWFQDGIHESVAVDSCVRLAKRQSGGRMGGLVNALLREALRRGIPAADSPSRPVHTAANLPADLYAGWAGWMSPEKLTALCADINREAPLCVRARRDCPDILPDDLEAILTAVDLPPWAGTQRVWACLDPRQFFRTELFLRGAFYIQDPSTLMAPGLLRINPGETIGDFCAAPGGKTVLLAEKLPGDARLIAADRSARRLEKLRDNLTGERADIHLMAADATRPPFPPASFDAILLDVPCSNTGVLRRRPDARWRFSNAALSEIVRLQADILNAAATCLKPGGRLVYSTCSIEPAENREQIRAFLKTHPGWTLETDMLLLPGEHWDGAYAARVLKK